jgi:hypothetical protein
MSHKIINFCRCCGKKNLNKVLDLKTQPLANSYHDGTSQLDSYPLAINVCYDCFHTQLSCVVDPDKMFLNYLYVSGTSKTLHDYFEWFVEMVEKENKCGSVLDIACNDGTQLLKFKNKGWVAHGIDPAKNLIHISSKNAHYVVEDYFNETAIKKLPNKNYDVIIAQNVFAHTNDVVDFLTCCKKLMKDESNLYIQTSQADMIENNQFDTIYHEHLSFFSTLSMQKLCSRVGLYLNDVKRVPIHGGSYIFKISKIKNLNKSVDESLKLEKKNKRYNKKRYKEYKKSVLKIIKDTKKTIDEYKKKGYLVVGYGAAAKGNTFLNAADIKLHFIIDDNPLKQNMLTPGSNTIILSKDSIKLLANNTVFLPLAWNFYDEIVKNIKEEVNKLSFCKMYDYKVISFFPKLKIESLK